MRRKTKDLTLDFYFRLQKISRILVFTFFLILILALISVLIQQTLSPTGFYRTEYEGRIIDKSLTFRESYFGSYTNRVLVIEDKNGLRFKVIVGNDIFERAQIGERIKSSKSGVEILPIEATLQGATH